MDIITVSVAASVHRRLAAEIDAGNCARLRSARTQSHRSGDRIWGKDAVMFSGYAAVTFETMREGREAARTRQQELDAQELRTLGQDAAASQAVDQPAPRRPKRAVPVLTPVH